METKLCGKCNEKKALAMFSKRTISEDGLQVYCKKCCARMSTKSYKRRQRLLGKTAQKAFARAATPTPQGKIIPKLPKGALVFIVPMSEATDIQNWCDQAMREYLLAKLA